MDQLILALKYENYTPVKTASNSYKIKEFLSPSCNILLRQRSHSRRSKEICMFIMLNDVIGENIATKMILE